MVSNWPADVILNSPLCRLARTHPWRRHSRIAWMRPLRGGVGEAQLPHRVVEQAREPAPQRQTAPVDLVEMVQDVHFDAALIGGQAPGLLEELLIAQLAERSSFDHTHHAVIIHPVER